MPLDGKLSDYEAPTTHPVLSLEGLRDWLRTKDPTETYEFTNCRGGCLIGQYLIARTGKSWKGPWSNVQLDLKQVAQMYDQTFLEKGIPSPDSHNGYNFGMALIRCEAAIADRHHV